MAQFTTYLVVTVRYHTSGKQRSLKARLAEHKRLRTVTSEASRHINIDLPNHGMDLEKDKILAVKPK